jgi:hypothetical protein
MCFYDYSRKGSEKKANKQIFFIRKFLFVLRKAADSL